MKRILLVLFGMFIANMMYAQSTQFDWVQKIGGFNSEIVSDVKVDASGNTYISGTFKGAVDFDPGPNTLYFVSMSFTTTFLVKLDQNGSLVWAKHFNGNGVSSKALEFDKQGNIVMLGAFSGVVDFNPSDSTVFNMYALLGQNTYVVKLNPTGELVNAFCTNGEGNTLPFAFELDANDNVIVCGTFQGKVDFDPGLNTHIVIPSAGTDYYVVKYSATGEYKWVIQNDSIQPKLVRDVTTDLTGNVYTYGQFVFTTDFDPGIGITTITPMGSIDLFVCKFDSNGVFQWAKNYGGKQSDEATFIELNPKGDLIISGRFTDTTFKVPNPLNTLVADPAYDREDLFFAKINLQGEMQWAKKISSKRSEVINRVRFDAFNNIYICGYFEGNTIFSTDANSGIYQSLDHTDSYVAKYNTNGELVWINQFEGVQDGAATSVDVNASGSVYTVGAFKGDVNFEAGPAIYTINGNGGGNDIYIHKMSQTPTSLQVEKTLTDIVLYPNPTSGHVVISSSSNLNEAKISVKNYLGKHIQTSQICIGSNIQLDLLNCAPGMYILEIQMGQTNAVYKLIKH